MITMRIEVKVLIVTIILLFSLGPIIYFFGGKQKIEVPKNQGNQQPVALTFPANITGKIINIKPFISYVGTSLSNDEAYVKSIVSLIADNYTVSTTLNPYGRGYRYEVTVFLKNVTDAKKIGFRLYFRLSPFFTDTNLPIIFGEILLPVNFKVGDNIVYAKKNTTTLAALLYSQDNNTLTTIYCPQIITSHNYNLTSISRTCTDLTQSYKYGLSLTDIAEYSEKEALELDLTIDKITSVDFEGYFLGNITKETIESSLPNGASALTLSGVENTTVFVFLNKTDPQTISSTKNALESLGVVITKEYKVGTVDMPNKITLSGKEYELFRYDKVPIEMSIDEELGTIHARVVFTKLFDEIENVEIERLT